MIRKIEDIFRCAEPNFRVERAENDLPRIIGHAAVFNSETDLGPFTESIAKGAFKRTLEEGADVRALFNHDPNMILGRTKAKTLFLSEDSVGLLTTIIPPDTQLGRDITKSIERGDISQMSFGFYIVKEEMEKREGGKPHFTITDAELFDVSPVTFAAYEATDLDVQRQRARILYAEEEMQKRSAKMNNWRSKHMLRALKRRKMKLY